MRALILFGLCAGAWAQTNAVAITVHPESPSLTIPADFLGLSFETGSLTTATGFPAENTQFQQMVSQLGLGWLRFGGNSVDKTAWIGGPRTPATPATVLTASDVDRVAAFARATGWRVLWGLRLANSSPAIDAAEADYVITTASDVLSGLEIGNEPDLYANNGYTPATLSDYLTAWGQYAAAIQAVHPNAVLTGPAAAGNINTWTSSFAAQYGSQIALLTQHYYPLGPVGVVTAGAPNEATIANMLGTTVHGNEVTLGQALTSIAQKAKAPWRMAETNSCYSGGQAGVSDVFASALWGIDYMFTLAGQSAAGVNFHGGGSGTYTPIAVSGSAITARPLYYALLFFGAAARGRVIPVNLNAGRINLTSFGVLDSDGTVRVVVINKDQALDAQAQITAPGGFQNVTVLRLSAPSLTEKTNIALGGASVAADGTWSPAKIEQAASMFGFYPVDVPAGSAVLVSFGSGKLGVGNTAGGGTTVAPNSMASVYGQNLGFVARSTPSTDLPTTIAAVSASVKDSTATVRSAPLIYVSPSQVNLVIPDGTAPGPATVYVGDSAGPVQVATVAPGLFTLGGTKVAAATALRYPDDGSAATPVTVFQCGGTCQPTPIALDSQSTVYLTLYGSGIRNGSNFTAMVGGVAVPVQFAGPQGQYPAFDQVNIPLPASLAGSGTVNVVVTVDGNASNAVQVAIQ
jgi:uncharacterized protein (TIGR03437 family)